MIAGSSTSHMRYHYEKLYNARPSPEIASTRPRPPRRRKRPSPIRSSEEEQYGQLSKDRKSWSSYELYQDNGDYDHYGSSSRLMAGRGQFHQRSPMGKAHCTFSSEEEETAEAGHRKRGMKQARASGGQATTTTTAGSAPLPPPSFAVMVSHNHISDKIDRFLDVVERCEVELQQEYEARRTRIEERRRRPPSWYRSMSNLATSASSRKTSNSSGGFKQGSAKLLLLPPKSLPPRPPPPVSVMAQTTSKSIRMKLKSSSSNRKSASAAAALADNDQQTAKPMKAFRKLAIPEYPLPDTSIVQSKLKQNRNYQPPRRRKLIAVQKKKKSPKEYEDDFEAEDEEEEEEQVGNDEEEEEEEEEEMFMAKQWINDQARRGMVRQRAQVKSSRHEIHDKESSKDSAYGYSGGESRLATREPTPDAFMQKQMLLQYHQHHGAGQGGVSQQRWRHQQQQNQDHRRSNSLQSRQSNGQQQQQRFVDSEDERSSAYVNFVNKVTGEILKRGIYTDKALRELLNSQAREHKGISSKEAVALLSNLRKELGIQAKTAAMSSPSPQSSQSMTNLKDLLLHPGNAAGSSFGQGRRSGGGGVTSSSAQAIGKEEGFNNISDMEMSQMLLDMDLEQDLVDEVLCYVTSRDGNNKFDASGGGGGTDHLRLFDSMNISNLNISFNNANPRVVSKVKQQQQELLIKSFAQKNDSTTTTTARASSANRRRAMSAAATARRQDSSSSNPDNADVQRRPVPKQSNNPATSSSSKAQVRDTATSQRPQNGVTANAAAARERSEDLQKGSQLPETPLHSSETPRSSSLYQPETDEEEDKMNSDISEDEDFKDEEEQDVEEEEYPEEEIISD